MALIHVQICFLIPKVNSIYRWLKDHHIHTKAEHTLRKLGQDIVGGNILAEKLLFKFQEDVRGEVIKPAPCIQVQSLKTKVFQQLDEYAA